MTPVLLPEISLLQVLLFAGLNPLSIWVAMELGRRSDQSAKLIVAAFAGALAGFGLLWLLSLVGFSFAQTLGRAAPGTVAAGIVFCFGWAAIGRYWLKRRGG